MAIPHRTRSQQFRQAIDEHVFTRARDALLVQPGVRSFTELCLAGTFRRQWPSLYAAIRDGRLDQDALERFLAAQAPAPGVAVYALDTALWPHPQAKTLSDRQLYPIHGSGLGDADAPLTPHGGAHLRPIGWDAEQAKVDAGNLGHVLAGRRPLSQAMLAKLQAALAT